MKFEHIGQHVRTRRLQLGISQRALARHAGLTATYLSRLESGDRANPTLLVIELLCEALDLEVRIDPSGTVVAPAGPQSGRPARRLGRRTVLQPNG